MKTLLLCLTLAVGIRSAGAAPFQNLDFEATTLPVLPRGEPGGIAVPISEAFPGWLGYYGTTPVTVVSYNQLPAGSAYLVLLSHGLEGNFTAALLPGFHPDYGPFTPVSLAQTGLVPSDAQSVRFTATGGAPFPPIFSVALDGQAVSWVKLEPDQGLPVYGVDVSAFAGQTVELRLTSGINQPFYLDAISFSPLPVPEPSSWALFGVGLLCLAGYAGAKKGKCSK